MNCINRNEDLAILFKLPFERRKIIYSINSKCFREENNCYTLGEKQLAVNVDQEELFHNAVLEFPCGEAGCRKMFSTISEYEMHYQSIHRLVCSECKRNFPSYNLLDAHILEKHDSFVKVAFERNLTLVRCFVEGCHSTFASVETRNEHAIKEHRYPPGFKFDSLKQIKSTDEEMDVTRCVDVAEKSTSKSSARHKNSVPRNICFGRGAPRSFAAAAKKKRGRSSTDISMKELADAL